MGGHLCSDMKKPAADRSARVLRTAFITIRPVVLGESIPLF